MATARRGASSQEHTTVLEGQHYVVPGLRCKQGMVMTCRKCKHLSVSPDKAGRIIPRKDNSYRCVAPLPTPNLPASVLRAFDFRWPPGRKFMSPDEGEGCALFEPRKKVTRSKHE